MVYSPQHADELDCDVHEHHKHSVVPVRSQHTSNRLCITYRYDDLKTAQENIDLQTTILSRFDLIFIVKDERSMDRDKMIARHVLDVHRTAGTNQEADEEERKVALHAHTTIRMWYTDMSTDSVVPSVRQSFGVW